MTKEDLGKYFERNDEIFHAIAYIDTPALELESISTGKRDVVVIGSLLSKEYKKIGEQEDRIQKAIEYIEHKRLYEEVVDYDFEENPIYVGCNDIKAREDLLDILRGNDNE